MTYNPNVKDPRILRRMNRAYAFARRTFNDTPKDWSTRSIDKYFGQQQNELSKWLRAKLLICASNQYNKDSGQCKKYTLNIEGANELRSLLFNQSNPVLAQQEEHECMLNEISEEFKVELTEKNFNYEDKSNRLWHPLQWVSSEIRQETLRLHGFNFSYDIQCAAPTLIHQHAQQQQDPMDLYLFSLRKYLKDRNSCRQQLAKSLDIDQDTTKKIINALFCGARIANNKECAIFKMLGNDLSKLEYLKQDEFITELRNDIKVCWDYIKPSMARRSALTKTGKQRMLAIGPKQKWARYFDLERKILNSVVDYMKRNNINYFLIHDGWSCDAEINTAELSQWVKFFTGYDVRFDHSTC